MDNEKYLYVVTTTSLKEKTEEDLRKEFEVYKARYSSWKEKTYEQFYDFQKGWNWHKYDLKEEDNSYFLNLEEAKKCVKKNFADINDGGVFNYVLIKKVPVGMAYAMIHVNELYIFKYERETDIYKEVSINEDEETKYIASVVSPITSK